MRPEIAEEWNRMISEYIADGEWKGMIETFSSRQREGASRWSETTLTVHRMLGGESSDVNRAAALTELLIFALDIADDLQDKDNADLPWTICPPEFAWNAVLALLAIAAGEIGRWPGASDKFGRLLARSVAGQFKDLNLSVRTEADYFTMVREKSGSLMRLACFMGYSLVGNLDQAAAARMDELAEGIGVIAQLENDLRDVQRFDVKNDLLHKKKTLPILYLLKGSAEEFPILRAYYDGEVDRDAFLLRKQECLAYVRDSGCLEYTGIVKSVLLDRAQELLASIPAMEPWKSEFRRLAFGTSAEDGQPETDLPE